MTLVTWREMEAAWHALPTHRRALDLAIVVMAARDGALYVDRGGDFCLGYETVPADASPMPGGALELTRVVMVEGSMSIKRVAIELAWLAAGAVGEPWAEEVARRVSRFHGQLREAGESCAFTDIARAAVRHYPDNDPAKAAAQRLLAAVLAVTATNFSGALEYARAAIAPPLR